MCSRRASGTNPQAANRRVLPWTNWLFHHGKWWLAMKKTSIHQQKTWIYRIVVLPWWKECLIIKNYDFVMNPYSTMKKNILPWAMVISSRGNYCSDFDNWNWRFNGAFKNGEPQHHPCFAMFHGKPMVIPLCGKVAAQVMINGRNRLKQQLISDLRTDITFPDI